MEVRGRGRDRDQGPVQSIVKGIAGGIGLVAEAYYHSKDKKRAKEEAREAELRHLGGADTAFEPEDQPSITMQDMQPDEKAWALDETQQTQAPAPAEENLTTLAASFIHEHPPPVYTEPSDYTSESIGRAGLGLPIIVPQRRPKARDRGFVRCYAPILGNIGIDEVTFLDFIDKLNTAVQPSPWIEALNLAGLAGMGLPEPFSLLVSIAVKNATDAAKAVHSRIKSNSFLDRLNAEFFRPRGLVCLVMTWQPEAVDTITMTVDFSGQQVAEAVRSKQESTFKKVIHSMQPTSSADTFVWPDVAPLVFPAESRSESNAKKNVIKRAGNFVSEYQDKRAAAAWTRSNPDSNIAKIAPAPTFRSRYADPNHPASDGNLISLLTGGALNPETFGVSRGEGYRDRDRGLRGDDGASWGRGRSETQEFGGRMDRNQRPGCLQFGPLSLITGARKLLQKDVLYLLIANLPSEEDLARAAIVLSQHHERRNGGC